jgi:uncharacterized protein with LGFP repeats
MTTSLRVRTPLPRVLIVAIAVFGVLVSVLAPVASQPAVAANASEFQDGYIISDQNFFDSGSMDVGSVQAFLNSKVTSCAGSNGQPCLRDYSTSATAIARDSYCSGMPGGTMSAAQIIVAAAQSCGISPKVILVMLQKEQGLITSRSPSEWNYRAAMGQSCPDTAPCDSAFSGFYRQVYYGARQMRLYIARPEFYAYRVGVNSILWNPNTACGRKTVNIQNDATRALYIYTPYTPNAASLNNLYGTGDGCSTYGNRNFWRDYTDWFGSPTAVTSPEINAAYAAQGGAGGWLGAPQTTVMCSPSEGWCYQWYVNGLIMYTAATGAQPMSRAMHAAWVAQGNEKGWMGYPITTVICSPAEGWCYQWFQNGIIMQTAATGAQAMTRPIHAEWAAQGNGSGPLGYPTVSVTCVGDTCTQGFQGGGMTINPAGTYISSPDIYATWNSQGGNSGWMGAPLTQTISSATEGWSYQWFVNGLVMRTAATGAQAMTRPIHAVWSAQGNGSGPLGYPTANVVCDTDQTCTQSFEHGALINHPTSGTFTSNAAIVSAWRAQGGRSGALGYPTANAVCAADQSCTQTFQRGMLMSSPTAGAFATTPEVYASWMAQGGNSGWLGAPLTPTISSAAEGWTYQWFANGLIMYTAATGAQPMSRAIHAAWSAQGNGSGPLGYPTAAPVCAADKSCTQTFQRGTMRLSATGVVTIG